MEPVSTIPIADLSAGRWDACVALWDILWPPAPGRMRPRPMVDRPPFPEERVHLVERAGALVAVARTWRRRVILGGEERWVLALASVGAHPSARGQGLGDAVARAGLARVGVDADVSLFQTDVPGFYTRMGARVVYNAVFDTSGEMGRFHSAQVLIYPGTAAWTSAPLDLCGQSW